MADGWTWSLVARLPPPGRRKYAMTVSRGTGCASISRQSLQMVRCGGARAQAEARQARLCEQKDRTLGCATMSAAERKITEKKLLLQQGHHDPLQPTP